MNRPDDAPRLPDGPPPAREQLPLPRRQRQSHLEPQLRSPGSGGAGTPFAAFAADSTGEIPAVRPARGEAATDAPADRAAAFYDATRRGRGAGRPRRNGSGPHRTDR